MDLVNTVGSLFGLGIETFSQLWIKFSRKVPIQSEKWLKKVPYFSISEKKWETFKITTFSRRSLLQSDCIGTFLENFILNWLNVSMPKPKRDPTVFTKYIFFPRKVFLNEFFRTSSERWPTVKPLSRMRTCRRVRHPDLKIDFFVKICFSIFDENSTFGEVFAIDREERRPRHDQWRSQGGPWPDQRHQDYPDDHLGSRKYLLLPGPLHLHQHRPLYDWNHRPLILCGTFLKKTTIQ